MGNPAYPAATGIRANWIDFDTVEFNKSQILSDNYASGGVTINGSLVAPAIQDEVSHGLTSLLYHISPP
ncbi:hypothetical protein GSI_05070 [Ganoderma sinense ZZ0214-1]|uniref:Uncharacterized protein n=1 Tax=Ganoderma sinense ZZ0214-1 TaxID=1077348 RepID=A0A2G8SGS2_9APHY|nr:hypothetical protein GSI_05070 [Ganoderma sinense ZZ0214-1]